MNFSEGDMWIMLKASSIAMASGVYISNVASSFAFIDISNEGMKSPIPLLEGVILFGNVSIYFYEIRTFRF